MPSDPTAHAQTLSGDESLVLPEFDTPPELPLPLLVQWIADAQRAGVREPLAASVATASSDGRVSSRIVLLKSVDETGIVFTSGTSGRKTSDLAENPHAAVTLYWRETMQQVKVFGLVDQCTADESDRFFDERPRPAQVASIVSHSSEPLVETEHGAAPGAEATRAAEARLVAETDRLLASPEPLVRPADWSGYRLIPDEIEFWQGRSNRLHRRLVYINEHGTWSHQRLQP